VLATGRESVAVNCLSGRGRTGTFSAIVLGKLLSIKTLTQLVDIIVGMRENRDGLVETPAQFKFAASALGLPDSSECSTSCSAKKVLDSVQSPGATTPFFTGFFVAVIIFVIFSAASKSNRFENLDHETLSSSKNNRYQHINKPPSHSQLDFDDGGIEANLKKKRES
jgi:Protein-tyrosine phosphatase